MLRQLRNLLVCLLRANQLRKLFAISTLVFIASSSFSADQSFDKAICDQAARYSRMGEFSAAHYLLRTLATDGSQRTWARAVFDCLSEHKVLSTTEQLFDWLDQASKKGSSDAFVQMAVLRFSVMGKLDIQTRGEVMSLLRKGSEMGNESANWMLGEMARSK